MKHPISIFVDNLTFNAWNGFYSEKGYMQQKMVFYTWLEPSISAEHKIEISFEFFKFIIEVFSF